MRTGRAYRRLSASLAGKVVWITGAAQGQGASHAGRFLEAGAQVGMMDVDEKGLQRTAANLRSTGKPLIAVADVSDWGSVREATDLLRDRLGPVDVIVANAAITPPAFDPVEKIQPEDWERVIAVNLTGVFMTVKAGLADMRSRGHGAILLIASNAGLVGLPTWGAYVVAKHGVVGLMRTLDHELRDQDVRVNAICPAAVDTPALEAELSALQVDREEYVTEVVAGNLLKRLIKPDEVSSLVLWLSSDLARGIRGVAFPLDGGFVENHT